MRCLKIDWSCAVVIQRAFPARHADAPFIPRLQSGEAPFGMRRDEVISIEYREIEKFPRDFYTDCMQANVFRACSTKTIAIKPSHRIATTTFELSSQDVGGHSAILALEINFVKCWIIENAVESVAHSSSMKKIVVAYWLIPAEPAHIFFQDVINGLAQRYNAPVFEPHVTIHVGANCADAVEGVLSRAAHACKQIKLKPIEIDHSSKFIKTLFVQFALNTQLRQLNESIRTAVQDSSDYRLNPHLSLLYKRMSIQDRRLLAGSIEIPLSEVIFDSLKAVRCISPTRNRADVEAWCVVAERNF
jgi:2'-5' RNA ligase